MGELIRAGIPIAHADKALSMEVCDKDTGGMNWLMLNFNADANKRGLHALQALGVLRGVTV